MSESRTRQGRQRKWEREEGTRVSGGNMTCLALRKWSKEGVSQRVGERDGGRRRETSHVQSHSPLGCTRQHTPSIIWLQLTHTQTHTHGVPPNGLLHSPFPYNPRLPALLMHLSYLFSKSFFLNYCYYYDRDGTEYSVFRKGLRWD